MSKVRTRFAPSPTGYMHIGNLRTALYTYLIAKSKNGDFILRIEDTDQDRYVEGALEFIYETLELTGLTYDEGPDKGGEYGPYIQSQRKDTYHKYAHKLVELGAAYPCFCTKERLKEARENCNEKGVWKYDRTCRNIDIEEAKERMKNESYVIRQKMPKEGETSFDDIVFGKITVPNDELEDQILLKADGLPTYNFANVVDDHLMEISHVVRGTEYLSSAPKYNLLYKAFDWEVPTYVHLTPIMKEPGKKLSKRSGDASFNDFYDKGYLKEAIINYIALLGWSPGTEKEIFTLDELVKEFSIDGLSKSPAVFDVNKLRWMNGVYIRNLSVEEFLDVAKEYIEEALGEKTVDRIYVADLLHTRVEVLSEIPQMLDFVRDLPDYNIEKIKHEKSNTGLKEALENIEASAKALEEISEWDKKNIMSSLKSVMKDLGVKTPAILWPLRIAASGKESTPGGVYDVLLMLGKEETLERLQIAIRKLKEVI
ncbi:MAG: glutamate--tRNA ligase [Clostridia bacterium]